MKKRAEGIILIAGLLLFMPGLAGCGGSSGGSATGITSPRSRSVSATAPNGLIATLTEDAETIAVRGSVSYTLTLTNPTNQTVSLRIPENCGYVDPRYPVAGLTVAAPTGSPVYPGSLPDIPCDTALPKTATQTIVPGQTLETTFKVVGQTDGLLLSPFLTTGVYTARASVLTSQGVTTPIGPLTVTVQQ